ncbi:MAG: hypothetical protein HY315_07945 [Acidobacteria bacterium]|nr:hypothetical protein [Acidobacteriota bacterium]
MIRKLVVLLLAALTVILSWAASRTGQSHPTGLALAQAAAKPAERRTVVIRRAPIRHIKDSYPAFHGLAIDEERGELFLGNDNDLTRWGPSIDTYRVDFAPTNAVKEPIRRIAGPMADLHGVCSMAVSPEFKEIYQVSNDGEDVSVYPLEANGDVKRLRSAIASHGTWGVAFDPKSDEVFVTVEHVNRVAAYRRTAQETDSPLRYVQGPNTELADPHGIYVDSGKNEIYVTNHGNWRYTEPGETFNRIVPYYHVTKIRPLTPSTGKFLPPSITVHARTANGDAKPLRVIQGSKTGMNLPLGIVLDPLSNQLAVANGASDAILFFDVNANGDVAPVRVLSGPATGLGGPTSVVIDKKRDELWVANFGNHTATVYPRTAQGNVAPLRTIRGAPEGIPATGLGTASSVNYNPKRKEILVPN